jgi:hypothetical protein
MLRHESQPRSESTRIRLRRRLMLFSAPIVVVALLAALKMISVVVAGNAAVSDFESHDIKALRGDVSTMALANIIAPENVSFAQGVLAAVEGNLGEADSRFGELLSQADAAGSCPVRLNLELVRETQGDLSARSGRLEKAEERYTSALGVIKDAPAGCFGGNGDPDAERRAIRSDAAARLTDKIRALHAPPARPPAPPPPAPPPPPPPVGAGSGPGGLADVGADRLPGTAAFPELRLDPGMGNPLDRLQEALANSDAAAQSGQ